MSAMPQLKFYNTLTREKSLFTPIDGNNVRMYVCGPTVYDFAHIGNARPVIVFDVLYRLLRHVYGDQHVTYVRNITDVDDKINARALRDFPGLPLNEAIRAVTEKTEQQFIADARALGCLEPDVQPRATDNIVQMVEIIQRLLDRGNAYVAVGSEGREVLFSVPSMPDYGQLSKRRQEDQQAGARIAVEAHKRNASDFVLWKESAPDQPGWHAEFTDGGTRSVIFGRPGWHIECSAMSQRYLGETFDIHGGGLDLIFPHHENEIAQSRCAHGTPTMANVWMHNGFLQVEGRKMSKSEGNFVTIAELLETEKFGGRKWPGEVLRLAMLMTHYRDPIDFSLKRLEEADNKLRIWASLIGDLNVGLIRKPPSNELVDMLRDDLDTPNAVQFITQQEKSAKDSPENLAQFAANLCFISVSPWINFIQPLYDMDEEEFFAKERNFGRPNSEGFEINPPLVEKPTVTNYVAANVLGMNPADIAKVIAERLYMFRERNFAEADRIRDELLAQGIQLKDGKDAATGERVTTWEVKR